MALKSNRLERLETLNPRWLLRVTPEWGAGRIRPVGENFNCLIMQKKFLKLVTFHLAIYRVDKLGRGR